MAFKDVGNISIENAKITFRNFSGKETEYNKQGNRCFGLAIEDEEYAKKLIEDGWNVKITVPKGVDEEPYYYIPVAVNYENFPPTVWLITKRNKNLLDDKRINSLDYAEIKNVDLIIRPYSWKVSGKEGIKAYLKTMYVTIEEDIFAAKYAMEEAPEEAPW